MNESEQKTVDWLEKNGFPLLAGLMTLCYEKTFEKFGEKNPLSNPYY